MKKLLFFLLLSGFAFGQEISPYYPAKQENARRGNEPSQLTYYDSQFVQGLLPNFLSNKMMMTQIDTDFDIKTKTLRQSYQDKFSSGKLIITLTTDLINSKVEVPEIIKSIKITGTPERVITFFVEYWDTTLDFRSLKSDVERKHMQDVARFYFNKGKPYITVTNGTFKNTKEFEEYFNKLLADNSILHK